MKRVGMMLLILAGAGCGGADPEPALGGGTGALATSTTVVTCSKLTVNAGSIGSGQTKAALAKQELSGTQDVWASYVELSRSARVTCQFALPAGSSAAAVSGLSLNVNYRGPARGDGTWVFEALDATSKSWVVVGDNGFAADWVWSAAKLTFPAPAARFVDAAGVLQVRYRRTKGSDVSQLDQWVVEVSTSGAPACAPSCAGKQCGADGCGGSCGTCGDGQTCDASSQCTASSVPGAIWKPSSATPLHFSWQLSETFSYPSDVVAGATVYDIDGANSTAETVAQLHALGPNVKVVCYMEVGAVEDYRDDYQAFVAAGVVGKAMEGWAGEYWIDIRQTDKVLPLLQARMVRWCANKGFDAIEPDDSDVWSNDSGFSITQAENDAFNQKIAELAHGLGLSIGLKNNPESAAKLAPYYDWALVEQCWKYDECDAFRTGFLAAGKAVWNVEYGGAPNCTQANAWHMVSMQRDLNLVSPDTSGYLYKPCIPNSQSTW